MKNKLFLINYTYRNPNVEHDATHYESEYYLSPSLAKAFTDIEERSKGFTVTITQYEEIFFREVI